jgi:hypothetical protein
MAAGSMNFETTPPGTMRTPHGRDSAITGNAELGAEEVRDAGLVNLRG